MQHCLIFLHTIHQTWDRPLIVRVGEEHQLLIDKVVVREELCGLSVQIVL